MAKIFLVNDYIFINEETLETLKAQLKHVDVVAIDTETSELIKNKPDGEGAVPVDITPYMYSLAYQSPQSGLIVRLAGFFNTLPALWDILTRSVKPNIPEFPFIVCIALKISAIFSSSFVPF